MEQMLKKVKEWSLNASTLLEGHPLFDVQKVPVHKDKLEALFIPSVSSEDIGLNVYTKIVLELIMKSMLFIGEGQVKYQLPGSKYFDPTQSSEC